MIKMISCAIYKPYITRLIDDLNIIVDVEFLEIKMHNEPRRLRNILQKKIDDSSSYQKIILLYGICGGSVEGLYSNSSELYVLRVHDCLATFLGSNKRYQELTNQFPDFSWQSEFNSVESYRSELRHELEKEYDEETVLYLLSVMSSEQAKTLYITFNSKKDKENLSLLGSDTLVIQGSLEILRNILLGETTFLQRIDSDQKVSICYDFEQIISAEKR